MSVAVDECHRRLTFNVEAYGTAWTGEYADTEFVVQPLVDQLAGAVSALRSLAHAAQGVVDELNRPNGEMLYRSHALELMIGEAHAALGGSRP